MVAHHIATRMAGDSILRESQSIERARKAHLCKYIKYRGAIERLTDELARRRNRQYIPAMPESNGSKRNPGASDRMANSVISRISFEEKVHIKLLKYEEEMSLIEDAVLELEDGLEQQVILLRYITGTNAGSKPMPWKDIALEIYGNDDDAQLQAVFRIHGRALQHIDLEGLTECGWNPEVAKARLTAIMEQNKEGDEHGQQE